MADSGKSKHKEASESWAEAGMAKPGPPSESQQSDSTLKSAGEDESSQDDEIFKSVMATLPPIQQWSRATIETLKFDVNNKHPIAEWQEESEWTRRLIVGMFIGWLRVTCYLRSCVPTLINAILASKKGWNWHRLKTCSNADYFSLPTHIITLLNEVFYSNSLDGVKARCEAGDYSSPLDLRPTVVGNIGYPIFRVDYTNDENFELYKTCWEQFLEKEFYMPEAVDRDDITWYWVNDKAKLDGKGPREVRELFQSLCGTSTFPHGTNFLWLCIMVDREAIESMLRVYGPPTIETFHLIPSNPGRKEVPFLPYITVVGTSWTEENNEEGGAKESGNEIQEQPQDNDGEYHGSFKCALQSIFQLWENEQVLSPEEYFPRDGSIWGDLGFVYKAPSSFY